MNTADWNDPIFKDEDVPYLAIGLYENAKKNGKNTITPQQVYTILERRQFLADFPQVKTFAILDEKGNLSKAAKIYLFKSNGSKTDFTDKFFTIDDLNQSQINSFLALVADLPASERFFYVNPTKTSWELFFAAGARDAMGIARYGVEEYCPVIPCLGSHTPAAIIEAQHTHNIRLANLQLSNYTSVKTHGLDLRPSYNLIHDIGHSIISSVFPNSLKQPKMELMNVINQASNSSLTKETWEWGDGGFARIPYNKYYSTNNIRLSTKNFFNILLEGCGDDLETTSYLLKMNDEMTRLIDEEGYDMEMIQIPFIYDLTPVGALVFIDMIENRTKWLQQNIDPDLMPEPFAHHYAIVKSISNSIKNNSPEVKIFKAILFQALSDQSMGTNFDFISQIIDEYMVNNPDCMKIKKHGKDSKKRNQNYLAFHNEEFTPRKFKTFLDNYLTQSSHHEKISTDDFYENITRKQYRATEMMKFIQHKKSFPALRITQKEMEFKVRPSLKSWIKANPWKAFFCAAAALSLIGTIPAIIYASVKVIPQIKKEQRAMTTVDNFFVKPIADENQDPSTTAGQKFTTAHVNRQMGCNTKNFVASENTRTYEEPVNTHVCFDETSSANNMTTPPEKIVSTHAADMIDSAITFNPNWSLKNASPI